MAAYEIIVGVDSNEARGRAVAEEIVEMPLDWTQVRVTLLHAFEKRPDRDVTARRVVSVRRAGQVLEELGIETDYVDSESEPARSILETATDRDADLIVVAGRKRTPAGKALFGSVTQSIILDSDVPVLVCGADDE
jgi:nucleotide-binding universal stress UspA family protein